MVASSVPSVPNTRWRCARGRATGKTCPLLFDYPAEILRLTYTTNTIDGYNREVRKVLKNKASLPSAEAARKLLYLAHRNIAKKQPLPLVVWPKILNQLAIRFAERIPHDFANQQPG